MLNLFIFFLYFTFRHFIVRWEKRNLEAKSAKFALLLIYANGEVDRTVNVRAYGTSTSVRDEKIEAGENIL